MDEKIVYIIIFIIWIVSSILKAVNKNAKKKAPEQSKPQPQQSSSPESLDDFKKILEEIISGKQPEAKPQTVSEPVYEEADSYETSASANSKYAAFEGNLEYEFNSYQSLESVFDGRSYDANRIQGVADSNYDALHTHDEDNAHDVFRFQHEGFDLRRAVIYSEILKRPHY